MIRISLAAMAIVVALVASQVIHTSFVNVAHSIQKVEAAR